MNFFKKWNYYLICCFLISISLQNCSKDSEIVSVNYENSDIDNLTLNFTDSSYDSKKTVKDSCTLIYTQYTDEYTAGNINFNTGSYLHIPALSLTPPEELTGKNVVISMMVQKDSINNELNITFAPHGCQFKIPAELCLSWKELKCERATLYYLDESGNRQEHLPDQIDYINKRMILQINHFSRYAVAYSN